MWADISAAKRFQRSCYARLRQLALSAIGRQRVLGDGASWIWNAAGRALSGSRQTLDIFYAGEHIAAAGRRRYREGPAEAATFHEHGRELILKEGYRGIRRLIGKELTDEDAAKWQRDLDRLMGYFLPHLGRIDYARRLAAGEAIGSGVVAGAAETLGLRLKTRGGALAAQERPLDGYANLLTPD